MMKRNYDELDYRITYPLLRKDGDRSEEESIQTNNIDDEEDERCETDALLWTDDNGSPVKSSTKNKRNGDIRCNYKLINREKPRSFLSRGDEFLYSYNHDNRQLPIVVILLGWAGCQDRYLAKYSAIYEERRCITLRFTAPVECLFWKTEHLPKMGKKLLDTLVEKSLSKNPIFFHVFSNGGSIIYQYISVAMMEAGTPLKVKGVIFDSAPGDRRLSSLYRAVSSIVGGNSLTNAPISFIVTFVICLFWVVEIVGISLGKSFAVQTDPTSLVEETYSWPQIFLYSNADTLIRYADVERFASQRAERGVPTHLVLFTDSPHVKHYQTYRNDYVKTVCRFINECLITEGSISRPSDTNDSGSSDDVAKSNNNSTLCLTKRIIKPEEASNEK